MRDTNHFGLVVALLVSTSITLLACASPRSEALERARMVVESTSADPEVQKYAPVELNKAEDTLRRASAAQEAREDTNEIEHLSYLAEQRAAIARAKAEAERNLAEILGILLQAERQKTAKLQQNLAELLLRDIRNIRFKAGSSDLKPDAQQQLKQVAKSLKDYPNYKIVIYGYADSTGPEPYNSALSERRADVVLQALINGGFDPARGTASGMGLT